MLSTFSSLVAIMLSVSACVKAGTLVTNPPEILTDVAYGTDPRQKMDIYLPENRSHDRTKLIVMIHGGSWSGGDKRDFNPYIAELQKRLPGYAFANVNYRLFNFNTSSNRFPAQEEDIKSAVNFLLGKASEYKISKSIILLGASAGGHLAQLQGYKNSVPGTVSAVVSFFGPTDLMELYTNPTHPSLPFLLTALTGVNPGENEKGFDESSPIIFITAASPPTILLQGGRDHLVPEKQSVLLKNKLMEKGVAHEYVFYPNEGHGWRGANLADSFEKIAKFLRKHDL